VSDSVVLSPHLDDAVLSCWHLLAGSGEVTVINVFAGVPNGIVADSWWDRLTGAQDSAQRMHERHEEDRKALAQAGREAISLPLLDDQYRAAEPPPAVLDALDGQIAPGAVVYAPAALSTHPDHISVRDAALALRARGAEIRLYADLPHALAYGWPAWVTGARPEPHVDPEAWWRSRLRAGDLDPAALEPEHHALGDDSFERKLVALRAYATQLPALEYLTPLDSLRHELVWRL
jgi:LmbE family N-acetylglucosaminyl deacetylase